MPKPSIKTTFTQAMALTPGTMSFRFERPEGFEYAAGQWSVFTLTTPEGQLVSHFTYCSSPTEAHLEFATRMSGSAFKNALLELTPGDQVEMEGPYGNFVLRDPSIRMACLIGGIGVTPLRSWLRYLDDTGGSRDMVVFYGSMTEDGIVFREELEAIAGRIPSIRLVHVLANADESWTGHRGYVNADIIRAELGDPLARTYFVCGPPPMIAAMRTVLTELEVPPTQLVLESFAGYTS